MIKKVVLYNCETAPDETLRKSDHDSIYWLNSTAHLVIAVLPDIFDGLSLGFRISVIPPGFSSPVFSLRSDAEEADYAYTILCPFVHGTLMVNAEARIRPGRITVG